MSDKEKEKASKRFEQPAAGIHVFFRPQCTSCKLNISYYDCKVYDDKPSGYMTNEIDCPERRPIK